MDDMAVIRRVRQEHERLREIKATLVTALKCPPSADPAECLNKLRDAFEHYRAHLVHRIALEEIGGFLNVVVERRPDLATEVENLRRDHRELISRAGDTMKKLRSLAAGTPEALEQAALLVRMSLAEVNYQEEAESLLVSFIFNQDTGVAD
jgi:hypothetical protein